MGYQHPTTDTEARSNTEEIKTVFSDFFFSVYLRDSVSPW